MKSLFLLFMSMALVAGVAAQEVATYSELIAAESFESGTAGNGWSTWVASGGGSTVTWGPSSSRASSGSWSMWCAGSDTRLSAYQPYMSAALTYGPFDLSDDDIVGAALQFDVWASLEEEVDSLFVLASADGWYSWNGIYLTSDTGDWQTITIDLGERGFIGEDQVEIGFFFYSDFSVEDEGVYIDNIFLARKVMFPYPASISVQHSQSFGNASQSSSYRMVSVPGASNIAVDATFSGAHGGTWNAYHDTGASSDYLVEFDGTSTFRFGPGRAFWVVSTVPWEVPARSVSAVTLTDGDADVAVPLHAGWNLIGNPFTVDVAWSDVLQWNGIDGALHTFSGSYSLASTMRPYQGYYYYNRDNREQLWIRYPLNRSSGMGKMAETHPVIAGTKPNLRAARPADGPLDADQQLVITARTLASEFEAPASAYVALASEADAGLDVHDLVAPPADFAAVDLVVVNEQFEGPYRRLVREVRPVEAEGQIFELALTAKESGLVVLMAEGLSTVEAEAVWLVDEATARVYDLRQTPRVEVDVHKGVPTHWSLLVGAGPFAHERARAAVPEHVTLDANYPNPFAGETIIEYTLAADAGKVAVELAVFDVLGRRVQTLVAGTHGAGRHRVAWDGRGSAGTRLASGLYLYRLRVGDTILTRKMILLE